MVLSRAGVIVMAMADVMMVGRYGTQPLAELSLGYAVAIPLFVAGLGAMVGIVSVTARGAGAGSAELPAGRAARPALVAAGRRRRRALCFAAEPLLRLIGHSPALVAGGGAVARAFALGALFQIVFAAASFYLEGTGADAPGLVAMIAGTSSTSRSTGS